MKDMIVIVVTIGIFALFVYLYLIIRPTIVLSREKSFSGCPDRWLEVNGECVPQYETQCKPYNPLLFQGQECEIARACGTSFKGMCN
jgi:hypothetical protein